MGEIRIGLSNHVEYYLKSDFAESFLIDEPIGWSEDDFEIERHKDYHGVFTKLSNNLKFIGNAMEYIESSYVIGGLNANCSLSKRELTDYNGDIRWVEKYYAIADFNTKKIEDGVLSVQFTSNKLAELIRSHEGDEFEIERQTSIDDEAIGFMALNAVEIKGRAIVEVAEADISATGMKLVTDPYYGLDIVTLTPFTRFKNQGPERHGQVSVLSHWSEDTSADNLIYVNAPFEDMNRVVTLDYDINFTVFNCNSGVQMFINLFEYNDVTAIYEEIERTTLLTKSIGVDGYSGINTEFNIKGTWKRELTHKQGIEIGFFLGNKDAEIHFKTGKRSFYKIDEKSSFTSSVKLTCSFVHDVAQRLMRIITGKEDVFYSKYFGREELGYKEDGFGGLIGLISGWWVREFVPLDEKYKSMTFSLKSFMDSLRAEFNIGIGIESTLFNERLRFEDLKYFYQSEVVVKFPYPVTNVTSEVDPSLFFSGLHFGYTEGGDYENSNGLDEPNVETEWVTPIRKSENKYEKKSKIRADEYAMELTRRKPKSLFPEEDTGRDDHNWFLDLKRTIGTSFAQRSWNETDIVSRIEVGAEPTGIYDPISWHSYLFSPLQMLFRHAWIFRGGLEPYLDKKIKHTKSKANQNVTTQFVGKDEYAGNSDIDVSKLERSRFLPEKITFNHPIDDHLMNWLLGTTPKIINGELEQVPNFYFKMEWVRDGVVERGYFLKLKSKESGNFEFQKANENLI